MPPEEDLHASADVASSITPPPALAPIPSPATDEVEWCLDLPFLQNRPFTAAETFELQQEAKSLQRVGCLMGCSLPCGLIATMVVLTLLFELLRNVTFLKTVLPYLVIPLGILPLALFAVKSSENYERGKRLKQDLRAGHMVQYGGPCDALWEIRLSEAGIPPPRLIAEPQGDEQSPPRDSQPPDASPPTQAAPEVVIEVLAHSRRLWKINGVPLSGWEIVGSSRVASTPELAAMAAAWVEPLDITQGTKDGLQEISPRQHNQRELSVSEKDELKQRIRQMIKRPFWKTLLFSSWLGVPLAACLITATPIKVERGAYFLMFCCAYCWFTLITTLRHTTRLNKDCENGYVAILNVPIEALSSEGLQRLSPEEVHAFQHNTPAETTDSISQPPRVKTVILEILPKSGWLWTEDGKASEWRKIPNAR
jgi:hypothetical protein